MFTGLVEEKGILKEKIPTGDGFQFVIEANIITTAKSSIRAMDLVITMPPMVNSSVGMRGISHIRVA